MQEIYKLFFSPTHCLGIDNVIHFPVNNKIMLPNKIEAFLVRCIVKCRHCLTGPCSEYGVKYTVYLISVTKQYYGSQDVEKWDVCRRFSDFHDFHMLLQEKVIAFDAVCHFDVCNMWYNLCFENDIGQC